MTTEIWGDVLAFACFPAVNLFWFLYATTAPWQRSWTGRAIITSKLGLAVLVDAACVRRLNHDQTYPGRNALLVVAFGLICIGTWLYLGAFVREQFLLRNAPRGPEVDE